MKIGFDVAQTCQPRAGCAWYADSLVRAMAEIAPEHQFYLYHQFGSWINPSVEAGTRIDAANITYPFEGISPLDAMNIWACPEAIARHSEYPDIIHAASFRAPKVHGAKLVVTIHDVSFWAAHQFATEANRITCQTGVIETLKNADGLVFVSQSAHAEFEKMLPGWIEERRMPWAITHLAPRRTIACSTRRPPGSPSYFLATGSLEPRKNYETLLDAMEIYWRRSERKLPLWIAGGPGWKSEKLKARIDRMASSGLVRHLGYVSDAELGELMAHAEAFIFPSWYEGFGLPVVEAMACGCPVVCSNSTSLPEVGGTASLYISPTDAPAIARAMERLEAGDGFRAARAEACIRQARRFDWKHTAQWTLDFYSKVLAQ